jgi:hypothetical protein
VLDHVSAQEADHLHREQGQEARLEERQRSDALRGVIDALLARHPKRRLGLRALLLHSQEQTYQEIARELGCKSSYARQLRWRGELWLQEFLLMHPDEHHTLAEEGQSYLSHALYILLKVLRKKLRGSSEGRLRLLVQGLDLDAGLRGAVFALLRDWQALERAFSRASAEQWRALWLGQQALSGATRSLVHFLFGQLPSRAGQRRAFASPGQVQGLDWGAELLEQGRCALRKLHEALRAPGRLLRPRAARSPGLLRRAQMTLLTCLPALPLARLAMSTVKPKARGEPRALRWSLVRRQRPRPGPAAPHQRSAPTDRRAPPQDTLWPPTGPPWLTWAQALGDEPPGSAPTRVIAPLDGHGCVQRRALSS